MEDKSLKRSFLLFERYVLLHMMFTYLLLRGIFVLFNSFNLGVAVFQIIDMGQ